MKDYYYILGLEPNATLDEIKYAHRSLSKKFHPDLNPNDKHSEKMFKDIQEAYECLSNSEKRRNYDSKLNSSNTFEESSNSENEVFELEKSKNFISKVLKWYLLVSILVSILIPAIAYYLKLGNESSFDDIGEYFIIPGCFLALFLYLIPTIIAFYKGHKFRIEIFIVNIFSGWFPVIWVVIAIFALNRINVVSTLILSIIGLFVQNHINKNKN